MIFLGMQGDIPCRFFRASQNDDFSLFLNIEYSDRFNMIKKYIDIDGVKIFRWSNGRAL
ncbi:MAG: hypothetical protein F6K48_13880 [Okeania sp. SIO3H1]|nr:hypothetical protein [Okeania sp. SIO3H1]